jgi:predicted phosphodiesterase
MDVRWIGCLALLIMGCPEPEPPCEPQPVIRGPWTVGLYARVAEIRWETAEPGCGGLRFAPEGTVNWLGAVASQTAPIERTLAFGSIEIEHPDVAGTSTLHRVGLQNLAPNTCYTYQISQPTEVHTGRLCTAAESSDATSVFAVLGDTSPSLGQTEVLYEAIVATQPQAILHLGDVQHYTQQSESWADWHLRSQPLLATAPILPVVGDHDFEAVDIAAGNQVPDPAEYQQYFFTLWGAHGHPQLGKNFAVRNGPILYIFGDTESDDGNQIWDEQGSNWLSQTLDEAEALPGHLFSVLMFHRPVYTRSVRTESLVRRNALRQVLAGHRVPLVLSGHAHCYERFLVEGRTFVVSGGGGAELEPCDVAHQDPSVAGELASLQQVQRSEHHWIKLSQTTAGLRGQVIAKDGTLIDQWDIRP